MPKAVRAQLPRGTLKTEGEIDEWLEKAKQELEEKLKQGPVIV